MVARRIAAAITTTAAALAAPASALAAHGHTAAHPSAAPLVVELAAAGLVALALIALRPAARGLRSARARLADRRTHRRLSRHAV